ncbi:CAunnamed protein product [Biomphalaria glabrata]|nr:CAunnamed protein product [Biomphalaria glabrata]
MNTKITVHRSSMDTPKTLKSQQAPLYIDNDVKTRARQILSQSFNMDTGELELVKGSDTLFEAVSNALQMERNAWKARLQEALKEIDKQHKYSLLIESFLQDIAHGLGMPTDTESPQLKHITACVQFIKQYLHEAAFQSNSIKTLQAKNEESLKVMSLRISRLEEDRVKLREDLNYKNTTLTRVRDELASCKKQLQVAKLQLQTFKNNKLFHVPQLESRRDKDILSREGKSLIKRNRLDVVSSKVSKNSPFLLVDLKGIKSSTCKDEMVKTVMKCLRCHQLFRRGDNNSKSCNFHSQGKQIKELCDSNGQLVKAYYIWSCCKRDADDPGCMYGHHY